MPVLHLVDAVGLHALVGNSAPAQSVSDHGCCCRQGLNLGLVAQVRCPPKMSPVGMRFP